MFQSPVYLWLLLGLPYFLWVGWQSTRFKFFNDRAAVVLRGIMVAVLIFGLAEITFQAPNDQLAVLYLLDISDSVPRSQQQAAMNFIQQSLAAKPAEDLSGLIVFGGNALVEAPLSPDPFLGNIDSVPITSQTDIGEAVGLAQALFPAHTSKRIVLLTDGSSNQGQTNPALQTALTNGIDIQMFPIHRAKAADTAIVDLQLPTRIAKGKYFDLTFTVYASASQPAAVRVLSGGQVISEQDMQLSQGEQSYTIQVLSEQEGVKDFEVQIINAEDAVIQNNSLTGVTYVTGPPRVLLVAVPAGGVYPNGEPRPDEAAALQGILETGHIEYDLIPPSLFPVEPAQLSKYNAVILVNIPGREMAHSQMLTLQSFVRDLGGGLITIGGLTSYGVGGYFDTPLEEILPINMQNKDEVRRSTLTLVYVIDRSNSMSETSGGTSKLELAKEAVLRSIDLLLPTDKVGVVVFDDSASWASPIMEVSSKDLILNAVGSIRAGGGTDILAGVRAVSRYLPGDDSEVKHVILLTDGGASAAGIPELVDGMHQDDGITLTSIGVGSNAAPFLEDLARKGGGRYYHVTDFSTIPNIFTEETTLATRSYIVERPFTPQVHSVSPLLSGISALPSLRGYVTSSPKEAASLILVSDLGDPILAVWQYGLGKAAAFTSDASGRWAKNWLGWEGYQTFWSQTIDYVSSPVNKTNTELSVETQDGKTGIQVTARRENGDTLNGYEITASILSANREVPQLILDQVGPGRYQAQIDALEPGSYTISLTASNPQTDDHFMETFGWNQSYSPEYLPADGQNISTGQLASQISTIQDPDQVFLHNLKPSFRNQPIWQQLLTLAAVLLVIDIAVRRLKISDQDIKYSLDWLQGKSSLEALATEKFQAAKQTLGHMQNIKQRSPKYPQTQPSRQPESLILPTELIVKVEKTAGEDTGEPKPALSTTSILLSKKRGRGGGV